jgi:hypothetical protein
MDLEIAEAEVRYKCPHEKCDGVLHKNKSKYSKGGYKCDGDETWCIILSPKNMDKLQERIKSELKTEKIVEDKKIESALDIIMTNLMGMGEHREVVD